MCASKRRRKKKLYHNQRSSHFLHCKNCKTQARREERRKWHGAELDERYGGVGWQREQMRKRKSATRRFRMKMEIELNRPKRQPEKRWESISEQNGKIFTFTDCNNKNCARGSYARLYDQTVEAFFACTLSLSHTHSFCYLVLASLWLYVREQLKKMLSEMSVEAEKDRETKKKLSFVCVRKTSLLVECMSILLLNLLENW